MVTAAKRRFACIIRIKQRQLLLERSGEESDAAGSSGQCSIITLQLAAADNTLLVASRASGALNTRRCGNLEVRVVKVLGSGAGPAEG